ncbi:hypothetical protein GCM10027180_33020 [Microbulbifer echini]
MRSLQRLTQGDNAYLFAIGAYQADFRRFNLIVYAGLFGPSLSVSFNSYGLPVAKLLCIIFGQTAAATYVLFEKL